MSGNNYWINSTRTALSTLPDLMILEFLLTNQKARDDFESAFSQLTEERQEHLTDLINTHPFVKTRMYVDPKTRADAIQRKANTAGIRNSLSPRLRNRKRLREKK